MSTLHYCDTDDCKNNDHGYDKGIFYVPPELAETLIEKGWLNSRYDNHLCKDCIDNYRNEEGEQLCIVDNDYLVSGKGLEKIEKGESDE